MLFHLDIRDIGLLQATRHFVAQIMHFVYSTNTTANKAESPALPEIAYGVCGLLKRLADLTSAGAEASGVAAAV